MAAPAADALPAAVVRGVAEPPAGAVVRPSRGLAPQQVPQIGHDARCGWVWVWWVCVCGVGREGSRVRMARRTSGTSLGSQGRAELG